MLETCDMSTIALDFENVTPLFKVAKLYIDRLLKKWK